MQIIISISVTDFKKLATVLAEENMVATELKRRGKEIYYHKDKHECDFLIKEKNRVTEAIQVCWELNVDNQQREVNGLNETLNKFDLKTGLILTYDQEDHLQMENKKVIVRPVWQWLSR